jgi:glutaredoxin
MATTVQVLMSPGCGHAERTLALLRELLPGLAPRATLVVLEVASAEEAARLGFPGSPTVRLDGRDIDPVPPIDVGLG